MLWKLTESDSNFEFEKRTRDLVSGVEEKLFICLTALAHGPLTQHCLCSHEEYNIYRYKYHCSIKLWDFTRLI